MSLWARSSALVLVALFVAAFPGHASTDEFRVGIPHDDLGVRVTNDFNMHINGRDHMGIDLLSPHGTPILALADGVVTTMEFGDRPGWYIVIDHQNGYESFYMHLNGKTPTTPGDRRYAWSAFARGLLVGDEVTMGEIIGYVGSSGNAEHHTPHTHLELHFQGEHIDPYPLVMSALTAARIELAIERGLSPYR